MRLRQLRIARRLTQVILSKKAGMKQPYLARLESGKETNPKLDALRRLAKALRVPLIALLK